MLKLCRKQHIAEAYPSWVFLLKFANNVIGIDLHINANEVNLSSDIEHRMYVSQSPHATETPLTLT